MTADRYAMRGDWIQVHGASSGIPARSQCTWQCPDCGHLIGLTVKDSGRPPQTTTSDFSPVHWPDADDGPIPFYGPSRRELSGKSLRRSRQRVELNALKRSHRAAGVRTKMHEGADYHPIEADEFDTVCLDCNLRVRVRLL